MPVCLSMTVQMVQASSHEKAGGKHKQTNDNFHDEKESHSIVALQADM